MDATTGEIGKGDERKMTREDAINRVQGYLTDYLPIEDYEEVEEIVKALEQESCEDAISRQAVLNTLDSTNNFLDETRTVENYKTLLEECYKNLPSVTPAPKKCHNVNTNYGECDQFVCSNCSIELQDWSRIERNEDGDDIIYHEYEFKYCPNCGAKINEKEKE